MSEFLVNCKTLKDFTMLTISRPRKKLVFDIRESEQHQIFRQFPIYRFSGPPPQIQTGIYLIFGGVQ